MTGATGKGATRVAWVTDIHLDFLSREECEAFYVSITRNEPDVLFITGDISVAPALVPHLEVLSQTLNKPIYFVLGNHDFYGGSITEVRATLRECFRAHPFLTYLPDAGIVPLTPSTALVGCDGWGDSRYGNYARSPMKMNDHRFIQELTGLTRVKLQQELMRLGDEAAGYLRQTLPNACDRYPHVILLTHVPPFPESCRGRGQRHHDEWLPFYACQAVGDVLLETMRVRPNCQLTVYCGHTHHSGTAQVLPNLTVFTGAAQYGKPHVNAVIEVR
ncbi:MAG: metallophosphoesterase [Nitrospira sp.]|nr:metallophosphoesterase [Nitrospira sp.]